MRVMIEVRHSTEIHAVSRGQPGLAKAAAATDALLPGFVLDATYAAVQIPSLQPVSRGASPFAPGQPVTFSMKPKASTYLLRGTLPDEPEALRNAITQGYRHPEVVGIHADPQIETCIICPGDPPSGTASTVAKLLSVSKLASKGLDGRGVRLAIVDTGFNLAYLRAHGRTPIFDAVRSWKPAGVTTKPGQHPVNHGTMCAYDAGIAAPQATLLDYAVLLSQQTGGSTMAGLLSDAVLAYSKLLQRLQAMPSRSRALVVSNSWGMFSPSWDFPVGQPGNYSDNPAHPFNVMVSSLEAAGADILFAAGNCGRNCPDGRCAFGATRPICGANSHPKVLSIAGIDVKKKRVGYSSQGPGRLSAQKPDLSTYTHFKGSGVYAADGGTSAACPVAAGVVAAIRTKVPSTKLSPAQLRALLFKTAQDLGGVGFDYDFGWGAIDPAALLARLP
jgi:subtilisin family serine protease